jgi:hypothetical protein
MTAEQIASLNLGISTDAKNVIIVNAALDWLKDNTTIDTTDIDNLPACAKLFLIKFAEISNIQSGVVSESIEGLSLSYGESNRSGMIWDAANELLGAYLKSTIRFVPAQRKYK